MSKKLSAKEQFEHINHGYFYRGMVINTFTSLERTMEMILTDYFITNDKLKNDFITVVLDRMTFESKRTSLKSLNERFLTESGFIKTKNNSYTNSKLFDEIRLLQEIRNNFAHFTIALPNDEFKAVLGLTNQRDEIGVVWYTDADISSINRRILNATTELEKVFNAFTGTLLAAN